MFDLRRIPVTALLLAAIGAFFVAETLAGGSTDPHVLLRLGANYPPLVRQGEYWRLLASMFLHVGLLHLVLNGWALLQLGGLCELLLGPWQMAAVYFTTGIAASLASVAFTHNLSAGASGAIFGLLGALISFLLRRRRSLLPRGKGLLSQLVMWAAINVAFGLYVPHIDNAAHLGGFAAGLLLGLALRRRELPGEGAGEGPAGELGEGVEAAGPAGEGG